MLPLVLPGSHDDMADSAAPADIVPVVALAALVNGVPVVRLIPAKHRIGQAQDFEQFAALVKQAFHQRRKTIRNNLKGLADDNDLQAAGISPQERAEHIAPEKYVALANLLAQKAG